MKLKLFGAFREIGNQLELDFEGRESLTVTELRELLVRRLNAPLAVLVNQSAFGSDERILLETDTVRFDDALAILPPVCGG